MGKPNINVQTVKQINIWRCENDEEIIEMESMISDLTAQERENRIYDLRNQGFRNIGGKDRL